MEKTLPPTVVNLTRDSLNICPPGSFRPVSLKFGRDLVSDMEVVNASALSVTIRQFIESGKLKPGPLVLILSDSVYFDRTYPGPDLPSSEEQEKFTDTIPFSASSSKFIPFSGGFRQVVVNRDYYEIILKSLEQSGFKITGIIPAFALGMSGADLTPEIFKSIHHKLDQALTFCSLLSSGKEDTFEKKEQIFMKKNKLPIVLLSLIFVSLAATTAFFTLGPIIGRTGPNPSSPVIVVKPLQPTPTPEAVLSEPATPSAGLLGSLSVRIVNASGLPGQAASLSAFLKEQGITGVQIGNSAAKSPFTTIVASPYAATAAGRFVSSLVEVLYPDAVLSADPQAKIDFVITLGSD